MVLPPAKGRQHWPRPIVLSDTEPPMFPMPASLDEVRPLDLRIIMRHPRMQSACEGFPVSRVE